MPQHFLDPTPILHEWRAWNVAFHIRDPLAGWPRPYQAALAETSDPAYAKSGRTRPVTPNATLQLTLAGLGEFLLGDRRLPLPAGSGFVGQLSDPEVAYQYPAGSTAPWRFAFLDFFGADLLVEGLVARHGPVFRLPLEHPAVVRLIHLAAGTQGRLRHVELDAAEGAALVVDLLTAVAGTAADRQESSPGGSLVRRAIERMEQSLNAPLDARSLAAHLGISHEHLCRIFRRLRGESPGDCFRRLQMRLACRLISEDYRLDTVASRLGYRDAANFGRAFRRVLGLSPGRWRQQGGVMPG